MFLNIITVLIYLIVTVLVGYGIWRILFGRHLDEIRAAKDKKDNSKSKAQNDINTIMGYDFITVKTVPKTDFEYEPEEEITDTIFNTESRNNGFTQVSTSDDQFHNPEEDEDPNEYTEIDDVEIADAAAGFVGMPDNDDEATDKAFNKYEEDIDPATIPEAPDEKQDADNDGDRQNDTEFNEIINMTLMDNPEITDIVDQIMQETEENSKDTEEDNNNSDKELIEIDDNIIDAFNLYTSDNSGTIESFEFEQ